MSAFFLARCHFLLLFQPGAYIIIDVIRQINIAIKRQPKRSTLRVIVMHNGLTAVSVSHSAGRMERCMQNRPFPSEWFCPNGDFSGLAERALLLGWRLLLSQRSQSLTHLVLCNTRTAGSLPVFYAFTALPWLARAGFLHICTCYVYNVCMHY